MKDIKKLIRSAFVGAAALSTLVASQTSFAAKDTSTEKCYGIAKAGKNDCASGLLGCPGSAKIDRQSDAFIKLPKGLCEKIAGGSLTPIQNGNDKKEN